MNVTCRWMECEGRGGGGGGGVIPMVGPNFQVKQENIIFVSSVGTDFSGMHNIFFDISC